MSKTVILLNPMGTDVTPYISHTSGYAQLLNGSVAAPGDTVYTLPYTNQPGVSNISAGKGLLDTKLKATSGEVLVFGYSEGCQIADWWLADQGATPATGVSPSLVSFLMIGNADRKYGGFSYNRSIFNSVGYTAGKPTTSPYTCVDLARQYDPIADFPTAAPIVSALVGLSYVGSDQNVYAGAMQSVANIMASTVYSQAVSNALAGLMYIHTGFGVAGTGYMSVTVSDPQNLSLTEGNITWVWSPTYPVPSLGTGGTFPQSDHQLRTIIEQAYTRPVTIPMPDYGNNSGWGVEPFPLPVSPPPVTGWWAELHVAVAITVTPQVSAAHGFIGAGVALVVTPAVSGSSKTLVLASVIQMVNVTASAAVVFRPAGTVTATPSITSAAALVGINSASITVTPSVSVAAAITTIASDSVAVTVTPSVTAAAVVTEPASVATTVTPTVSAAVQAVDSAAVTVTPTVSAAALASTATAITVTPTVSVSASVVISGPTFDAVGAGALNDSTFGSISWAHTAASGADLFVFIENETNAAGYLPTAVTYNGNAMTSIAATADSTGDSGELFLYHLAQAGTGSSKNVIVTWGTNPMYANCNSISFNNVAGVGSPGYAHDSNSLSTPTQSATLALPGTLILQGFGYHQPGGSVTTSGGTADYSFYDSTSSTALTINHAASTQTFTGSTALTYWAGIDVALYPPLPVAITVTPSVSVSMGAATVVGAVATTVTPSVSVAATVIKPATVTPTVTPTITAAAGVTRFGAVAETVTPTVSVAGVTILPASVAVTATPSISTATADDTSINVTVTPAVTVAAVVTEFATVATTVTPTVTTAGVVTEFANVSVTATPAVTVGGNAIYNIASAVTATPSVGATSSTAVAAAITVTPAISTASADDDSINITVTAVVSVAATVIELANVAVTATTAITPVGGNLYTDSATVTATPSVSDGNATAVILPVSVAITATPTVSVSASVTTGLAYDNSTVSTAQSALASGTAFTWSHTAASGAYALVAVYSAAVGTATTTAATAVVKFGASTMTSLGSISLNNLTSDGFLWVFGLASPPSGAQTVSVKFTQAGHTFTGWASAYTYTGVSSVGSLQTAAGSSTSPSVSVSSGSGDLVWGAISNYSIPATVSRTISSFSLTQRTAENSGTSYPYFVSGDTTGATTVTVSATLSLTAPWAAVGLNIL